MRFYKLSFHSALHVDSRGSGEPETAEEFIRSDTLSGALCLSWNTVFQEADAGFFMNPPFRLSSAFPFIGDLLLYPAPAWRIWAEDLDEADRKRFKSVRWLAPAVFERVLDGKKIGPAEIEILPGGVALTPEEADAAPVLREVQAWAMSERQRVSVDRLGVGDGGLFFFALQFFRPDAGLWFLANMDDADAGRFRAALDYLGDTGIGADRNSGLGHFRVAEDEVYSPPAGRNRNGYTTLSLFNPDGREDLGKLIGTSAYRLTTRSGWITGATVGRPPIRVFAEGSYFSARPKGRVVEMLNPSARERFELPINHGAPRDFRAVFLPCAEPPCLKEVSR
ncbi:MAG: type III-A CRISPR-associated RAMP protein Csm4 [Thermodesulfobacteriota bacterium]